MSKIVKVEVPKTKCTANNKYNGMYYPIMYFEDSNLPSKRIFALAGKSRNKVILDAEKYAEEHNRKEEAMDMLNKGIAKKGMERKPISELLEEYMAGFKVDNLKEPTIREKRTVINNTIKPFYGDKVLCELSNEMMAEYKLYCMTQKNRKMSDMDTGQLSSRRIQKFWEINKTFINWLKKKKYIIEDPTEGIKRPQAQNESVSQYWKMDEFKKFMEVIPTNSQYRALFLLAFFTGMREGEILGLTWGDVDFKNNEVKIEKQFNTKTHQVDTPKTKTSQRKTKIINIVKDELISLKEQYKEYYTVSDKKLMSLPIFTNGKLEHLSAKTVSNRFKAYIEKSGVKKIKFHELRNSFITNSIDNNVPVDVVSKMVGHSKVTTTMDIYKCTTDKHKEEALDTLNKYATSFME